MNKVIAIAREFGSGGRELGERLAAELGYAFYDKEILTQIVTETKLSEGYIHDVVEAKPQRFFPVRIGTSFSMENEYNVTQMQNIFAAQNEVITQMAQKSNCVIVGRCSDYILEKVEGIQLFKLFIYADMDAKVKRCFQRAPEGENLTDKEMRKQIQRIDKERAAYYSNYTLRKWGDLRNYDFCVNTTGVDLEAMIPHFAKLFTLPPKPGI